VRAWHGTVTKFNVPGAGKGGGQGTIPLTDNALGATGSYFDDNNVIHGFLVTW